MIHASVVLIPRGGALRFFAQSDVTGISDDKILAKCHVSSLQGQQRSHGFWIRPNRLALDKKLSLQTRGRYTLRRVAAGARLWSENRALLAPLLVQESGRTTRELRDRHTL